MSSHDDTSANDLDNERSALSARRARLRGLAKSHGNPYTTTTLSSSESAEVSAVTGKGGNLGEKNKGVSKPTDPKSKDHTATIKDMEIVNQDAKHAQENMPLPAMPANRGKHESSGPSSKRSLAASTSDIEPAAELSEILNNIEQASNVCAVTLSNLQKSFKQQNDALIELCDNMKNQTITELGLNLSQLMESLSAALEPMKAVGELVPAIDQLASAIQTSEIANKKDRLSLEQLVSSLADKVYQGQIDAWTFKCAYMALYPTDDSASLMHRLVDLLTDQRLSAEFFRAAYEAMQAPEPPPTMPVSSSAANANSSRQLKELEEQFNARWKEFDLRYEELTQVLKAREDALQLKEQELAQRSMELSDKDSENKVLRAQIGELKDQAQEMAEHIQKQVRASHSTQSTQTNLPSQSGTQTAAANPTEVKPNQPPPQGFFEVGKAPGSSGSLFDAENSRPLFAANSIKPIPGDGVKSASSSPSQGATGEPIASKTGNTESGAPQTVNRQGGLASTFRPNTSMPTPAIAGASAAGSGSYGTGVRAQVFEVIVRQALTGAPWRETCAGPMQVNNISAEEVENEVKRRQALLGK